MYYITQAHLLPDTRNRVANFQEVNSTRPGHGIVAQIDNSVTEEPSDQHVAHTAEREWNCESRVFDYLLRNASSASQRASTN